MDRRERVGGRRPREAVGDWRAERRQLVVGQEQRQLVVGQERESWWQETKRGSWWLESREKAVGSWTGERSCGWTGERRTERLAWIHGGAVNTRHRAERRGDKIGSSEEESQDV